MSKALHIYAPVVTVPIIMACFGFRPRTAAILCTMGISITLSIYYIFIKRQSMGEKEVCQSLIYGALTLLIIHYILPKQPGKGWIGIPDDSLVALQNQETKRWWLRKIKYIQSVFTKPYWSNIFPKQTSIFIGSVASIVFLA